MISDDDVAGLANKIGVDTSRFLNPTSIRACVRKHIRLLPSTRDVICPECGNKNCDVNFTSDPIMFTCKVCDCVFYL